MSGAKTEEPTPSKLRKLRKDGDVPISRELTRTAALVSAVLAIAATLPSAVSLMGEWMARCMGADRLEPTASLVVSVQLLVVCAAPILATAAFGAFVAGAMQTGLNFAPSKILPQMGRFKPGQTWTQRLKVDAVITGTIGFVTALVGIVVAYGSLRVLMAVAPAAMPEALPGATAEIDVRAGAAILMRPFATALTAWLGVSILSAIADASWQRRAYMNRHKMSQQEIRDEYKQSEGDPQHKARRDRAHQELLREPVKKAVGRSDVIIRNPTHLAIGLRYRPDELDAPIVTVAERGDAAKAVLREARRRGVPEFADKPVARALVDIAPGDPIPEDAFAAVAIIFRWLQTEQERADH